MNFSRSFILSVLVLFFAYLSFSCNKNNDVIDENKFVDIYVDLVIAQDTSKASTGNQDSVRNIIFEKHSISEQKYENTVAYYNQDPEKWNSFFEKAKERIDTLIARTNKN